MRTTRTAPWNRLRAGLLVVLATLAGIAATGLLLPAPRAAAAKPTDDFISCLNGARKGDVLVLVDTSASLQNSDAEAARVRAGELLLRSLANTADGANLDLAVSLAGFANRYEPTGSWDKLNKGTVERTLTSVREFANRNTGQGTDYWLGLDGARKDLAARQAQDPDRNRCQAIVFFTDGSLDIDRAPDEQQHPIDRPYAPDNRLDNPAQREQAKQAATTDMCRDGGLADQLRTAPVTIFGIGLAAGGSNSADFDLMKRVVTGEGEKCGKQPATGEFFLATNIDSLIEAFSRITYTEQPPQGVCKVGAAKDCTEAHNFVLDSSITSVSVLGYADFDEPRVVLVSPSGQEVELEHAGLGQQRSLDVDGAKLSYQWASKRSFQATLADPSDPGKWTGRWRLVFFDPSNQHEQAVTKTSLQITGNLFPAWPQAATTTVRAGETARASFALEDAQKKPVDPAKLLGEVTLDATLIDDAGQQTPIAQGLTRQTLTQPQQIDATRLKPGKATVRLSLNITTAAWTDPATGKQYPGTKLQPQQSDITFDVQQPAGFGSAANSVDFGVSAGKDTVNLSAGLPVRGPGCYWVEGPQEIVTGPKEITTATVGSQHTSAATCLEVADGGQGTLPLTLASAQVGNGALNGRFTVKVAALQDRAKIQDADVTYTAEIERPLNTLNFALALIAGIILGPGIPIGLLYLAKSMTAKIPPRPLQPESIPITVENGRVLRNGQDLAFTDRDFTKMASIAGNGEKNVDVPGATLRARTGGSPFGPGYVLVDAGPQVGLSSAYPEPFGKAHQAKLPLAVHNSWVLLRDPGAPANTATLLFLVAGDSPPSVRQDLLEQARRTVPQAMGTLTQYGAAPSPGPQAGGSPFGGPAPFGGGQQSGPPRPPQQSGPPPQQPPGQNPFRF